jgi:hypothetical protein
MCDNGARQLMTRRLCRKIQNDHVSGTENDIRFPRFFFSPRSQYCRPPRETSAAKNEGAPEVK